jgi:HAD superfamily hydrolase (TIGR01509 family)
MAIMEMGQAGPNGSSRIRGVIFDMDGTLIHQALDFEAIRREIGLPPRTPLLEALDQLTPAERAVARDILDRHEQTAAAAAVVLPGVCEFLTWLGGLQVRRAVLTRNSRSAAAAALSRCGLVQHFDPIVSRDDAPFKPQPEGVWQICAAWGLPPAEIIVVGDYLYDIEVGRRAGTRTALITHGRDWPFAAEADLVFVDYAEGMGKLESMT